MRGLGLPRSQHPSPPTPLPQGERGEEDPSPPTPLPQGERGDLLRSGTYRALKSAANALALSRSPVANFVSSFHGSVRPGSKTCFFMKSPTPLLST